MSYKHGTRNIPADVFNLECPMDNGLLPNKNLKNEDIIDNGFLRYEEIIIFFGVINSFTKPKVFRLFHNREFM